MTLIHAPPVENLWVIRMQLRDLRQQGPLIARLGAALAPSCCRVEDGLLVDVYHILTLLVHLALIAHHVESSQVLSLQVLI